MVCNLKYRHVNNLCHTKMMLPTYYHIFWVLKHIEVNNTYNNCCQYYLSFLLSLKSWEIIRNITFNVRLHTFLSCLNNRSCCTTARYVLITWEINSDGFCAWVPQPVRECAVNILNGTLLCPRISKPLKKSAMFPTTRYYCFMWCMHRVHQPCSTCASMTLCK